MIKLPTGKRISRSFSILKFGRDKAFGLAKEARAHMLTLIDDRPYLQADTAKRFAAKQARRLQRG